MNEIFKLIELPARYALQAIIFIFLIFYFGQINSGEFRIHQFCDTIFLVAVFVGLYVLLQRHLAREEVSKTDQIIS